MSRISKIKNRIGSQQTPSCCTPWLLLSALRCCAAGFLAYTTHHYLYYYWRRSWSKSSRSRSGPLASALARNFSAKASNSSRETTPSLFVSISASFAASTSSLTCRCPTRSYCYCCCGGGSAGFDVVTIMMGGKEGRGELRFLYQVKLR